MRIIYGRKEDVKSTLHLNYQVNAHKDVSQC